MLHHGIERDGAGDEQQQEHDADDFKRPRAAALRGFRGCGRTVGRRVFGGCQRSAFFRDGGSLLRDGGGFRRGSLLRNGGGLLRDGGDVRRGGLFRDGGRLGGLFLCGRCGEARLRLLLRQALGGDDVLVMPVDLGDPRGGENQSAHQNRDHDRGDQQETLHIELRLIFLDLAPQLRQEAKLLRAAAGFGLYVFYDLLLAHVPTFLSIA